MVSDSVFGALTESIDAWWSTIEGVARKEGDVFKVSFGPGSYWKFKVLELRKNESITWVCLQSHQDHHLQGMDQEWLNTKLHWNLENQDQGVKLDFLHEGLNSSGVCFEVCSTAWDFYLFDSLKSLLEAGVGKPAGT